MSQKELNEILKPQIESLFKSIYSAVLYNLGDLQIKGAENIEQNFEMAEFNIGLLELLKEKTSGNLTSEEQQTLDELISSAKVSFLEHTQETKES